LQKKQDFLVLQTNGSGVLSFATPSSGTNSPAFFASRTSSQNIANATNTKIQFNIEGFDTDSCYDNVTNYRFTPNVAGKYFVYATVRYGTGTDFSYFEVSVRKNNASAITFANESNFENNKAQTQTIVEMNGTTDYLEAFTYHERGGDIDTTATACKFFVYKMIGI
jgi:hypothetical protein